MLWTSRLREIFGFGKDTVDDRGKMPAREFPVNVTAISVRTKDYLRADIQTTVYVAIGREKESIKKATEFFGEGNKINPPTIANAVTNRAEAAIREVFGEYKLEELPNKREDLKNGVEHSLIKSLERLGLEVNEIAIGNIEENENYSANNYFDAKIIEERTEIIQQAICQRRIKELETQKQIREKELETQEAIRKKELATEKNIRTEELDTEQQIRNKELAISRHIEKIEIEFETVSLTENQTIETAKLMQEQAIEVLRLQVEAEIKIAEEQQDSRVEKEKIKQDIEVAVENEKLQSKQAEIQQTLETKELDVLIAVLIKEQEKLIAERERAKAQEAVNTAIEAEKADCRHITAQKAAEAAREEANAIEALTKAESERYQLMPPTDSARMAQIIQQIIKELAPQLMEKLPELAKALAPQPGVLGDSNVYTFPGVNGEGVNQLILATSGMLLLNTLMEGKLGQMLEKTLKSIKDDQNTQSS